MKTLSKPAEDEIISSLRDVVTDVDGNGTDPNDAIEKVAREHKWGRGIIKFASHAYNTGRQTAQREDAKDALGKFAEFSLADPDRVIDAIWPSKVDTPAEKAASTVVSTEYNEPPRFLQYRDNGQRLTFLKAAAALEKKAADDEAGTCPECNQPMGQCSCSPMSVSAAYAVKDHAKRAFEQARQEASAAYDNLFNTVGKLASYFGQNRYDRLPLYAIDVAAQMRYGAAGERLMGVIHDGMPKSAITGQPKEARYDPKVKLAGLIDVDPTNEPMLTVDRCIKQATILNKARAAEQRAKAAVDAVEAALVPFVNPSPVKAAVDGHWSLLELMPPGGFRQIKVDRPAGPVSPKLAGFGTWMAASAVGSGTKSVLDNSLGQAPSREEQVNDQWMDLEDPEHDSELRKIRAQANISEMLNDEFIGQEDPEKVLRLYNQISQMAPRVANQPLAMTAILRRHLQGGVEPPETKDVSDLETSLKNQDNPEASTFKTLGTHNAPTKPAKQPAA